MSRRVCPGFLSRAMVFISGDKGERQMAAVNW